MPKLTAIFFCVALSLFSYKVKSQNIKVSYRHYSVSNENKTDATLDSMLKPYAENMYKVMNTVIGFSTKGLFKKLPESTLGNFFADCIKNVAEQQYEQKIDIGFINYGSIRKNIFKGDITIGNIYEVLPYDNFIVIQNIDGIMLKNILNHIAEIGGVPISGITMQIKNKQATNILINNLPFNENDNYTIATYDFIANGGNGFEMLKNIPIKNKSYLFREAVIDYIKQLSKQGRTIDWKIENRITFSN
ncbi:MAG: 5'-nucleotidase C-terminal domain-containing protein [Chitinophagales bacterium]|nr:5'-nucleotidase C-terminal domain-containing protein [Chitinophagales bacterium]